MNIAHYHLVLSHIPAIGMAIAMLINIWALFKNSTDLKRATLFIYLLSALVIIPVYFTGEGAGEIVRTIPGITETLIEPHEETALFFFIGLGIIGALSIIGLFFSKKFKARLHFIVVISLLLALSSSYFAINTAFSGGKIRHSEIEFNVDTLKLVPDND